MSQFLGMFKQMGGEMFSKGIGQVAPYFATIDPEIMEYKQGYCALKLRNQKKVHNHLGTIHAIAMCNAAELVAGMTTDASIPTGARWIPQGMSVEYLAKAKSDLKIVCDAQQVDFSTQGNVIVSVTAFDDEDRLCFTADITMNVKHA